jgi:hypothetical protein
VTATRYWTWSLAWLVKQKKITPHIPVFDKSNRSDGTFSRVERNAARTLSPARSRGICTKTLATGPAGSPQDRGYRRRKKVEMLFAHLKRFLRLTRLRLRGPNGANDEFLLAATAQNLRRLARLRPMNMLPEMLAAQRSGWRPEPHRVTAWRTLPREDDAVHDPNAQRAVTPRWLGEGVKSTQRGLSGI